MPDLQRKYTCTEFKTYDNLDSLAFKKKTVTSEKPLV